MRRGESPELRSAIEGAEAARAVRFKGPRGIDVKRGDFVGNFRRTTILLASFGAVAIASVFVVRADWPTDGAPLGLPWWAHLLLLGVVGAELLARVLKLQFSAKALDVSLNFRVAARTIMAGDFAGALTPARSGTEPARFLVLRESKMASGDAIIVLFLELCLEVVTLACLGAALLLGLMATTGMMRGLLLTVVVYTVVIAGVSLFAVVAAGRRLRGPSPLWARRVGIGTGQWRRIQLSLRRLRSSVRGLRQMNVGWTLSALGFSLLHGALRLTVLPVILLSYGRPLPLAPLLVWPLFLLYGVGIAPAPGGGGAVELAFKASLSSAIPSDLMATSLIWWRVYTFYAYLVLGAAGTWGMVMRSLGAHRDRVMQRETV